MTIGGATIRRIIRITLAPVDVTVAFSVLSHAGTPDIMITAAERVPDLPVPRQRWAELKDLAAPSPPPDRAITVCRESP